MSDRRRQVAGLAGGPLEYVDTGGDTGPPLVLLHGALMDDGLWHDVIDRLPDEVRCVVPILPMGAHRLALPDADVSPRGIAALVAELVTHLGITDPVVVGNDTGGAIAQLLAAEHPELVAGLVLISCDAYDNFPPGLPGRVMALSCRLPGGLRTAMATLRWAPLRRLPLTFGWMARRPIDDALFRRWLDAFAADGDVRRDVRRMMRGVDRTQLTEAAEALRTFPGRSLVVWAADDRVMPRAHADRLVETLPDARLELVADSYTLVPLDQPAAVAELVARFAGSMSVASRAR